MVTKHVLFFDGTCVSARLWQAGRVRTEETFLPDPAGLEAFAAYLVRHRNGLFYFLADVAEEGFQLENIPPVQGGDRNALLTRRLGQYYYGTPYAAAVSLGHSKKGRRDERILFTALTQPDAFAPWLKALRSAAAPLVGLYSVPLALAERVPAFVARQERFLLVTLSSAGLRQTFFTEGEMQFSRLTPLASRELEAFAIACGIESAKTYQYLVGQRQISRGSALSTFVLAHAEHLPLLQRHCLDSAENIFQFEDINTFSASIGLKTTLPDSDATPLLVHRLLTQTPKEQFAPSPERQMYRLWKARFSLRAAAAAILAGVLLFSARQFSQWQELRQEADALQATAMVDGERYNAILDGLPKSQLTPDKLRAVIGGFDELQRRSPGIEAMLRHLGQALLETPSIELQSLKWMLSDKLDTPQRVMRSGIPGDGSTMNPSTGPGGATPGGAVWTVLEVNAELPRSLSSDQRAQVDRVENLASRLRGNGIEVSIKSMPIDIESAKPLKSQPVETRGTVTAPRFALQLTKPLQP